MKTRWFIFLAIFLLTACSNASFGGSATITPDFAATDTASQIGTAVAARSTEAAIEALYTPTPTEGVPALKDLILTSAEANELANRWSDSPTDATATDVNQEMCKIDCVNLIWEGGADRDSILDITLIKFESRDAAASFIVAQKNAIVAANRPLITLSELVSLPEETYGVKGPNSRNVDMWGLATRQGNIVILLGVTMPDLSEDENILFLSLFTDRQIQKLVAAGY